MNPYPSPDRPERTVILGHQGLRELNGFTQIPNAILKHPTISFGAKVAFGVLLSFAWQDDFCWPAQERLGEDMNCSDRQVRRLLVELKEAGLVSWSQRGLNKPNLYVVLPNGIPGDLLKTLKHKDRTDSSGPDRTHPSALERTNTSDKEYSENKIQNTVNGVGKLLGTEENQLRVEVLVEDMLDTLRDRESIGLYRLIANQVPEELIYEALSETRQQAAAGRIRKSRGAYFTARIRQLAEHHGVELAFGTIQ